MQKIDFLMKNGFGSWRIDCFCEQIDFLIFKNDFHRKIDFSWKVEFSWKIILGMKKTFFDKKSNVHHNIDFLRKNIELCLWRIDFSWKHRFFIKTIGELYYSARNWKILPNMWSIFQKTIPSAKNWINLQKNGLVCQKIDDSTENGIIMHWTGLFNQKLESSANNLFVLPTR